MYSWGRRIKCNSTDVPSFVEVAVDASVDEARAVEGGRDNGEGVPKIPLPALTFLMEMGVELSVPRPRSVSIFKRYGMG